MRKREAKAGVLVRVIATPPKHRHEWPGWIDPEMDRLCGEVVTIRWVEALGFESHKTCIYIKEDPDNYVWSWRWLKKLSKDEAIMHRI